MDDEAAVTAAEIARLAGVGRAAVSNWRRRYADFPEPIGGTTSSPTFSLDKVEQWLRGQGKLGELSTEERVWHELHAVRDDVALVDLMGHIGAFLLYVRRGAARDGDPVWEELSRRDDAGLAGRLPELIAEATADLPGRSPAPSDERWAPPLRDIAKLAARQGAAETYESFLGRYVGALGRRLAATPTPVARFMVELAQPLGGLRGLVVDPACGTGSLLVAAAEASDSVEPWGREVDEGLARLSAIRLALRNGRGGVCVGDSLRDGGANEPAAGAVLSSLPFNERDWGHDELIGDPRWEYGLSPRSEPELAWVQHALSRLEPGAPGVVMMPPAAAGRRSGRRIRAELLRRGALRAVIALPDGAVPWLSLPVHLWVLRRPDSSAGAADPSPRLLVADAQPGAGAGATREDSGSAAGSAATAELSDGFERVLRAWRDFLAGAESGGSVASVSESPGAATQAPAARTIPVIELLDDEVDVGPARHLTASPPPDLQWRFTASRDGLVSALSELSRLVPDVVPGQGEELPAKVSLGELARAGGLAIHAGPARAPGEPAAGEASMPMLTPRDVVSDAPASGSAPLGDAAEGLVRIRPGDVIVPAVASTLGARPRVVTEGGAVLGQHLYLLRADSDVLDPYFLAGFLRGPASRHSGTRSSSGRSRFDVRRVRVPRLPLAQQRRYGQAFRRVAEFERTLRRASELGGDIAAAVTDGLADGQLAPPPE